MGDLKNQLPKPNKTTAKIVVALFILALPLYLFLLRPAQRDLNAARETEQRAEQEASRLEADLDEYRSSPYSGPQLQAAVSGIDRAMPPVKVATSPVLFADDIAKKAADAGLAITNQTAAGEYVPFAGGGEIHFAEISLTVTGQLPAISQLVTDIESSDQFATVDITDVKGGDGKYTATLTVRVFASATAPLTGA